MNNSVIWSTNWHSHIDWFKFRQTHSKVYDVTLGMYGPRDTEKGIFKEPRAYIPHSP
ncbi:hypothetical protein B0J17DRAFT_671361 [Rhizoctonia solani]|nr:hypothetical protein B0J17DRAFT_671361 [Rhizoctonia solani]